MSTLGLLTWKMPHYRLVVDRWFSIWQGSCFILLHVTKLFGISYNNVDFTQCPIQSLIEYGFKDNWAFEGGKRLVHKKTNDVYHVSDFQRFDQW